MLERRVRLAGMSCLVGGILWVITLALMTAVTVGSPSYMVEESVLVAAQVMLLIGVLGLAWSGAVGHGWLARGALGLALLGRVTFVLAELHAFVSGADDSPLLPLGALFTAIGMLLIGIAVLRAGRWNGWPRVTPLLCGLYPFLAMFPFIVVTDQPNPWAIAGWGVFWALLGLAMRTSTVTTEPLRPVSIR